MSYFSAITAFTLGSFVTAAQAALKAPKVLCDQKVLSQAFKQIETLSAGMNTQTTEGMKRFMVKTAEARDIINGCFGIPLAKEALANKAAGPVPPELIKEMIFKNFGIYVEAAHPPIHISEARDFIVEQAAKVTTAAAKVVATTVEPTVVQATAQVATEEAKRTFTDMIGGTTGLVIGGAILGFSIYAVYKLFFASKTKSN